MPDPAYDEVILKTSRAGYDRLRRARPDDLTGIDRVSRDLLDSGEMTAHDSQITALKARIAELEGVLGELMEASQPLFLYADDRPAGEFALFEKARAAAKSTLEPTTSGEEV